MLLKGEATISNLSLAFSLHDGQGGRHDSRKGNWTVTVTGPNKVSDERETDSDPFGLLDEMLGDAFEACRHNSPEPKVKQAVGR